ncbi:hypothetical protein CcaverHIS002_0403690 [Cutaneotrichosporon cavernicola]|uniref:Pirin N-terminal domain-containing protein n=1 Tax=Cutaneotrichosporon cavernicola TaxID=279322 RepID=A0AA48QVP1_9TREE|nr:uncharacterized protein CcaverHIS019_0403640 [Cutaneotrichosporon cavernicola]BEI83765.1 hypothetical protein CcaverHIS002_0403690 [Cutaneotrichosporon cavernicola]BEI91544.1 hypothetical protein CcaverHIS019_0403640 [Cutaneotrichosporon cavernicola]BEI99321.1 hypothetical protein CcaverHIS631_0403640 [Cutaneotrichosporon cavernicola]BEJ07097.1 hypothetical protein CcaverHIS641_0403660 [Cutaneotrichosporon cavernicola]
MPVTFKFRPSETRGAANHGWLKSFHTFNFASYYDPSFEDFGCLRVINEDRVDPSQGFPTHSHREANIFSYVISGELAHQDSMKNVEQMGRGDVQMTFGGTGISHSEYNDNKEKPVHFLQIWAYPYERGLKPRYFGRHFTDEEKKDKWAHIVAPLHYPGVVDARDGSGPVPIASDLNFFASLVSPGTTVKHNLVARNRGSGDDKLVYVQLVQTTGYNPRKAPTDGSVAQVKISLGGETVTLAEGDGVFIRGGKVGDELITENVGNKVGEVVLFEMDSN